MTTQPKNETTVPEPKPTRPVALITGSGRQRLGSHIARGLADDGFQIAIHYHRSQQEAEHFAAELNAAGAIAHTFSADLRSSDQVRSLVQSVVQHFGRLDVLVNTASVWKAIPLEDVSEQDLQDQFDVDLKGTFFCCQAAGLQMVKHTTGGAIVNFGDWALERPYPEHAAYFAIKSAIPGLSRSMARELATRNPKVRVNCILPGPVLLPPTTDDAERQELLQSTLVRQVNRPDSIVNAVRYLIGDDFITGVCLPVDGGRTIFAANESR